MNSENNNKDLRNAESSVFEKKDYEINISEMFMAVVSKIWILILAGLIAAIGAFFYTTEFISPTYRSSARVYILNRQSSTGTSMSDLNSAATLKNDFVVLIKSRNVYKEVLEKIGENPVKYASLSGKVSLGTATDSRVVDISVTDTDPVRAKLLVDAFAEVAQTTIKDLMNVQDIKIVSHGEIPSSPIGPNLKRNISFATMLGVFIAATVVILVRIFNDNVTTSADVERILDLSVLGSIPDISLLHKTKKSRHKSSKKKNSKKNKA